MFTFFDAPALGTFFRKRKSICDNGKVVQVGPIYFCGKERSKTGLSVVTTTASKIYRIASCCTWLFWEDLFK